MSRCALVQVCRGDWAGDAGDASDQDGDEITSTSRVFPIFPSALPPRRRAQEPKSPRAAGLADRAKPDSHP